MSGDGTRLCVGCNQHTKPIVKAADGHQIRVRCPACDLCDEIPQGGHA